MIELKKNQIIQDYKGTSYILKHILIREGGVIAINEENYEFFIKFKDFKVIFDPDEKVGGA